MTNPTAKLKNKPDNARLTPTEVINASTQVLTDIDVDPASDPEANTRVNARMIFTEEQNGLNAAWHGRVFLNPPGGKRKLMIANEYVEASISALWWAKLLHEVHSGRTTEAIFVCFNLEAMLNTQKWTTRPVQAFPYCVPRYRLKYQSRNGGKTASPPGASAIIYIGNNRPRFVEVFNNLGFCTEGLSLEEFIKS